MQIVISWARMQVTRIKKIQLFLLKKYGNKFEYIKCYVWSVVRRKGGMEFGLYALRGKVGNVEKIEQWEALHPT